MNPEKVFHEWLKTRLNMVKNSTELSDKRVFALTEALMTEIDFLSNDLSDRTKTLLGQTNFLWTFIRTMGDAVVSIAKEVEHIKPMAEQIKKFQQQDVLSIKEQIDSRVKQRAEQIQNEIQQEKERVDKDLPGVT
jgi:gas vesicle protein